MEYEVIIAPRAIKDLEDILLYVISDRPEAAKRLALALFARTKILARPSADFTVTSSCLHTRAPY